MTKLNVNNKLVNLEYSLSKEYLSTNRIGGYMCSTPVCCNTTRYHGLMVCPIAQKKNKNHLLLSSVDETIIEGKLQFNLAVHRFPDTYYPNGNKYVTKFDYSPVPTVYYTIGDMQLKKEMVWLRSRNHLLIKYTLLSSEKSIVLRVRPFMAFRDIGMLRKANMYVNTQYENVQGGIKCDLYDDYPSLYIQNNSDGEFLSAPEWYYNFEYIKDKQEGLDYLEDLFTIGVFDVKMSEGNSVVFSFSTTEVPEKYLNALFDEEVKRHSLKNEFKESLIHSVGQFVVLKKNGIDIISNYPYKDISTKDALKSIVQLSIAKDSLEVCVNVIDTLIERIKNGLFTKNDNGDIDIETSLWFFYTLESMERLFARKYLWDNYGNIMKGILEAYSYGIEEIGVSMHDNGLIWNEANTSQRKGYMVDICALWYNAVCYCLSLAKENGDFAFASQWEGFEDRIKKSFESTFFIKNKGYLADYVYDTPNTEIRSNQIVACALSFKPISDDKIISVMSTMAYHLRSSKGLRTLSPNDIKYIYGPTYHSDNNRLLDDGAVSMFMTYLYSKTDMYVRGKDSIAYIKDIISSFTEDYSSLGVTNISDYYQGDPPYEAAGATSSIVGVTSLLGMIDLITE